MSSITDVSNKLGQHMLQGWVLTDQSCPTAGCSVPLMRSPNGRSPVIEFCVNCDGKEDVPTPTLRKHHHDIDNHVDTQAKGSSVSDTSSSSTSHISRSSTPPTEISSALSSPIFAPPADTEELRLRREQSDRASSEIGKRLLKGWAMLGDECPNARCYGVPLVRPPRVGGGKDPRKECVVCGTTYTTEVDLAGRERLITVDEGPNPPVSHERGKVHTQEDVLRTSKGSSSLHEFPDLSNVAIPQPIPFPPGNDILIQPGSTLQALAESSKALQSTLHMLSARLTALSSTQSPPDTVSIGLTADAVNKVTQALIHVRQLQWSECQAQRI